jgi:selenocysteine-specific elongation factor
MLGNNSARLNLGRAVPTVIGERFLLRDPGSRTILSATVLDPMPPKLSRRGDARRRAEILASLPATPNVTDEVRRRVAVRRRDLIVIGVEVESKDSSLAVISAGGWLIDAAQWAKWLDSLRTAVDDWAVRHPLRPGMPRQAATEILGAPDVLIVDSLVRATDTIVIDGDGIHRRGQHVELPLETERALAKVLMRLDAHPFAAPGAPELIAAGLTERVLSVAVQEQRLIRVAAGIYLRPEALEEAARRLARLDQPFNLAQARETLGTTRRVAVPLLEQLDRARLTRRLDTQLREFIA